MKKVLFVFGTRPEAIKMCPLIIKMKMQKEIECKICLTGQHREMLKQVMDTFDLKEDYNLNIMKVKQSITGVTVSILQGIDEILDIEKPNFVFVHGDTTTSFVAALAAFYKKISVCHVEAGLRTNDKYSPYPEEMNRRLISRIADIHFAPTKLNKDNLLKENVKENVYITGNTVIDSFAYTIKDGYVFENKNLNEIDYSKNKIILLTAHRRENWGENLENIFLAVKKIAENNDNVMIIYPVHLNPVVRDTANKILHNVPNIKLIEPLSVIDMHNLIAKSYFVMTDSGGLQEEAPALGKPVLVLRKETERKEAVKAGTAKLIGVDCNTIIKETQELIDNEVIYNKMSTAINPYGDGHASEKIIDVIRKL